uniref:Uncharacterized protein n=1 Tax=Eptatretus burgeri TaxID=7764 RepID=A0A8C4N780_EPTBU
MKSPPLSVVSHYSLQSLRPNIICLCSHFRLMDFLFLLLPTLFLQTHMKFSLSTFNFSISCLCLFTCPLYTSPITFYCPIYISLFTMLSVLCLPICLFFVHLFLSVPHWSINPLTPCHPVLPQTSNFAGITNNLRREELPTLLHFAARYGFCKLATELLHLPGAFQAYSALNCHGFYPNNLIMSHMVKLYNLQRTTIHLPPR